MNNRPPVVIKGQTVGLHTKVMRHQLPIDAAQDHLVIRWHLAAINRGVEGQKPGPLLADQDRLQEILEGLTGRVFLGLGLRNRAQKQLPRMGDRPCITHKILRAIPGIDPRNEVFECLGIGIFEHQDRLPRIGLPFGRREVHIDPLHADRTVKI